MFSYSIDRGGTFTDVHCVIHDQGGGTSTTKVMKLLSEDPENYADAPREGIRRFLEAELGVPLPREGKIPTQNIRSIRMGTTVATNALLERRGERVALVVTKVRWDRLLDLGDARNSFDSFDSFDSPDHVWKQTIRGFGTCCTLPTSPGRISSTWRSGCRRICTRT